MRVNQLDGIRRAKELWAMGYEDESRAEWNHTTKKLSPDELYAAGRWPNNGAGTPPASAP